MARGKRALETSVLADEAVGLAIGRLQRRREEVIGVTASITAPDDPRVNSAELSIASDLRAVFGTDSVEFKQNEHYQIWKGPMRIGMPERDRLQAVRGGLDDTRVFLEGLIGRLEERRAEQQANPSIRVREAFDRLDLHVRIGGASVDLYRDGHYANAVLNAGIALVNYVKEKSGRHDIDGAALMTTVFSKNAPVLAFNDAKDKTDQDEQEGLMHLFVGAVQALRNPRAHILAPDSPEEALEAIALFSFLAKRLDMAKRMKVTP
jgi:uncharacterized protein (TIGR02391 family)